MEAAGSHYPQEELNTIVARRLEFELILTPDLEQNLSGDSAAKTSLLMPSNLQKNIQVFQGDRPLGLTELVNLI